MAALAIPDLLSMCTEQADLLNSLEDGYSQCDGSDLGSGFSSGFSSGFTSGTMTPSEYMTGQPMFPEDHLNQALTALMQQRALEQQAGRSGNTTDSSNDNDYKRKNEDGTYSFDLESYFPGKRAKRTSRLTEEEIAARNQRRLQHNRVSAKQSRERKKMFIMALEQEVVKMAQQKDMLQSTIQELAAENERLRQAAQSQFGQLQMTS